ncbi:uncharacterized protein LOC134215498 [Armigeres subalbatus]|uniref:uncharacterized protein LOC134215498 n=1 Tax=Armigeres subalbatus TaxID=124917 RepID=UPI002ED09FAE
MLPLVFFVLLAAPVVLSAEENMAGHLVPSATASAKAGLAETSRVGKAIAYNMTIAARKPKRSNVEIPLLIIRPIDKKKKISYKDHMVKLMTGGVASYGSYPDMHSSDHEVFSFEHMLPILGLEGMVFNNAPKTPHFIPSPHYKPSEYHFSPPKFRETSIVSSSFDHTEAEPVQTHPSSAPPNFVPAINTEEQLLKLGHQALSKLETPRAPSHFSPVIQDKPVFIKTEHLPSKFNSQHVHSYKSVPTSDFHPAYGPGMHNEIIMYHKPQYYPSKSPPSYKWHEQTKKPHMSSPLSISTNFYYPKHIPEENYQHPQQQYQALPYYQPQLETTPAPVQTHVSYFIPKEIEPLPVPQTVVHEHAEPQQIHQPSLPVNTVQNGEQVDFVVVKQPSVEEPPKAYYKSKYHKQPHSAPHATYYIHKQFEYPGKGNSNENKVVSEYHGTHNRTKVELIQHHSENLPYSAPQYLPLQPPQQESRQQPSAAYTLHQTQPQPQSFHQPSPQTSAHQNHWKLGRRNQHEQIKPVVEQTSEPEPDNQYASSLQTFRTAKPAEKSTTEVKVEIEHVPQTRSKEKTQTIVQPKLQQQQQQQQQQPKNESTSIRPTTTRAGRQG